jgi:hypothetical protein
MISKHLFFRAAAALVLIPIAYEFRVAHKSGQIPAVWFFIGLIAVLSSIWIALLFFDKLQIAEKARERGWSIVKISYSFQQYWLQFFGGKGRDWMQRGQYNVVYRTTDKQLRYACCRISFFCNLEWVYTDERAERRTS